VPCHVADNDFNISTQCALGSTYGLFSSMRAITAATSAVAQSMMRKIRRLKKFCSAKRFPILVAAIFLAILLISLHYYGKSRNYVSETCSIHSSLKCKHSSNPRQQESLLLNSMKALQTSIVLNIRNSTKTSYVNKWKRMMNDNDCCFIYSAYFDSRIRVAGMRNR
jgi:hypothetical protein